MHACIDKRLDEIATKLKVHLVSQNTEQYIKLFSAAIEQATAEFGQLDSESYQKLAGRSKNQHQKNAR